VPTSFACACAARGPFRKGSICTAPEGGENLQGRERTGGGRTRRKRRDTTTGRVHHSRAHLQAPPWDTSITRTLYAEPSPYLGEGQQAHSADATDGDQGPHLQPAYLQDAEECNSTVL